MRVPNIHWCSSSPRLPSGFSRLWSGPAPKLSSEIEKPATRTFVITHSLVSAIYLMPSTEVYRQLLGVAAMPFDLSDAQSTQTRVAKARLCALKRILNRPFRDGSSPIRLSLANPPGLLPLDCSQ